MLQNIPEIQSRIRQLEASLAQVRSGNGIPQDFTDVLALMTSVRPASCPDVSQASYLPGFASAKLMARCVNSLSVDEHLHSSAAADKPATARLSEPSRASEPYASLIHRAARDHGVDPDFIYSVIRAESNFDPTCVSSAGATGLMQLMPATARYLDVTDIFDPAQNIDAGTRYLKEQLDRFDDPVLALAAYNAGPGAVKQYDGVPPYKETQSYIRRVLQYFGEQKQQTGVSQSPAAPGSGGSAKPGQKHQDVMPQNSAAPTDNTRLAAENASLLHEASQQPAGQAPKSSPLPENSGAVEIPNDANGHSNDIAVQKSSSGTVGVETGRQETVPEGARVQKRSTSDTRINFTPVVSSDPAKSDSASQLAFDTHGRTKKASARIAPKSISQSMKEPSRPPVEQTKAGPESTSESAPQTTSASHGAYDYPGRTKEASSRAVMKSIPQGGKQILLEVMQRADTTAERTAGGVSGDNAPSSRFRQAVSGAQIEERPQPGPARRKMKESIPIPPPRENLRIDDAPALSARKFMPPTRQASAAAASESARAASLPDIPGLHNKASSQALETEQAPRLQATLAKGDRSAQTPPQMTADDQSESRSDSVEVAASRKAAVADTTTSRRINRVVQTAVTEAAQKARVGEATGDIIHERVVVKLSPPELGEVTVDIHRRQEGVRVMLQTDSIGAATHLRDNANSLQGTLRDMGLHLDHFEVACNADGGGWMPPDGRGEGRSAQALRYEGAMPPQEVEQETVAHQASRSSHTVDVIA